jgi:arginyl-tRNA synthetase
LNVIKERIEQAVRAALEELGAGEASFVVSRPTDMTHGDFATNAALSAAKALKKNPKEVAELLREKISLEGVEKVEVAGAGFINFFLTKEAIGKEVIRAATDEAYGSNAVYSGKKIMVEYTDPNPFKEFHIGHLMSNAIGESIARLLERSGATVVRANYQGDVGPHVAKTIWAVKNYKVPGGSWGDAYVAGNKAYDTDENAKKEIDEINKKVYDRSDKEINEMYDNGRQFSLAHFEEIYKVLGTKFDLYYFESKTAPIGVETVKKHPDVFVESEGATVFKGESYGLHTRVFITKLGLPTYEAKELGLVVLKQKEKCDEYIYITANEQNDYFKVVFLAAKLVFPDIEGKLVHRSHGMMRFAQGKMSSRLGNVITGESLIMSLKDVALEKMKDRKAASPEKVAEDVAVGAIKYVVLKQGTGKDIIFDPEKSLSVEGDSGPYLQYAHTRALSLIREAKKANIEVSVMMREGDSGLAARTRALESSQEPRAILARTILHFPDALQRAASELEPHHVTTYLTELASTFNSWYASERLIGGENPEYGLLLTQATEKVLATGLEVLGIRAPEEM